MKEKNKKKSPRIKPSQEKTDASVDLSEEKNRAAELYVRDILIRGEAAKPIDGKLPPGATHEIVKENPGGLPTIRRRRYFAC